MADAEKIEISNLEELKAFRDAVNAGESYKGKTVVLTADIDLKNEEWTPIGNSTNQFQGNFDGQGHTVSNLKIDGTGKSNQGFFGFTTNGSVSNLTIKNATVTGRLNVGVVAGTPYTSKYTNIKVTGHVEVEGMAYVGGVGGKNAYADWTDITVDVDETSFVKADSVENGTAYRTYVGGVIGFMGEGGHTLKNITSNINVEGSTCDVGGIVGIAHYGNNLENVSCTAKEIVVNSDDAEVGAIAGVWHNASGYTVTMVNCTASENTTVYKTVTDANGETVKKTVPAAEAVNGAAYTTDGSVSGKLLMATEKVNSDGSVSVNITKVDAAGTTYDASAEASKILNVDASQISSTDGVYTSAVTYKAKIGSVYYESFEAALDAAKNGDEITLLSNISDAEYTIDKNITIRGNVTLNNVDIKVNASLALYGLKFTGTSDILTASTATALTLENCTADVDPGKYSGRGAFITTGQSESSNQALKLVLKNNVINSAQSSNDLYSAAVFGWAYLGHVEMTGNTFGSASNPYTFVAVKTMNATPGAVFNIANNTVYGSDSSFTFYAFDLYQNNSRENEYTAVFNNNSVVNTNTASSAKGFYFSRVEVKVYGGIGGNASVQVLDNNTVNGEKVTAADVQIDDKKAIDYVGTDVKLDSYGNIVGGNFTVEDSAAFREDLAAGMAPQVNADGSVTPVAFDATKFYVSDTYSGNPGDKVGEGLYFDYNAFASLKDAADKAVDGVEIELLSNGKAAANFDGGGTVTLTGNADLDWSKGWFFIGRGTNAQDTTLIIKDAAIGSTSNNATYGFHVSNAEKDSSSKADGTLIIDKSAVTTDYLINKNVVNVIGDGDFNDDEVDFYVKNGFYVAGRNSNETVDGVAHTAYLNITNGAYVKIGNENSMGIGAHSKEEGNADGKGVLNITDSKFESTQYLNCNAHGIINVTDGELVVAGKITNDGTINVAGESELHIGTLTGNAAQLLDGAALNNSTVGGNIDIVGASATLKGEGSFDKVVIQGNADEVRKLTIAENAVIDATNLDTGLGLQTGAETNNTADRKANGIVEIKGEMNLDNTGKDYAAVYLRPYSELVVTGTLTVNGELHNRGSLYIDGGEVKLTGFVHHKLLGWGASGDRLVITNGGVLDVADQERVELGYTSHPNANSNVQPQYATGMYAEISNGGKFTAASEYFRNNCALTVTGAGSEFIITDGDESYTDANGSWNKGTITVTDGALFDISGMDKELVNSGTITVDADSLLKANTMTNNGAIIIDASGFTGGVKKVIDLNGTAALSGVTFTNVADGVNTVFGSDGDVTLVNVDQSEVLINTGYTSQDAVDAALGANVKTYGGNAFESIASAVANTATNNPLKLTFTGSETVASTGIVYVTADTDPNVAPHSVGNFDGRDVTISGINNSAERLWVDLNDTATDDTVAASKLTFYNAKLNVSKLKASYNSVININNSELNAEYIQSSNLYGKGNGIINVTGSKLIGFNQTSALGGAVISLSDSELESGSYNRIEQGSLNVLNGSKYTFSELSIAKGGTLNVTDSVVASKEMLALSDRQNVQHFPTDPAASVIVKVGYDWKNNESAGTLNLTGSEFTLTKAQYEENGEIKYTGDAQFIVGAQGTVNVTNSKFTADTVTNAGKFYFRNATLNVRGIVGDGKIMYGNGEIALNVDTINNDICIGCSREDGYTYYDGEENRSKLTLGSYSGGEVTIETSELWVNNADITLAADLTVNTESGYHYLFFRNSDLDLNGKTININKGKFLPTGLNIENGVININESCNDMPCWQRFDNTIGENAIINSTKTFSIYSNLTVAGGTVNIYGSYSNATAVGFNDTTYSTGAVLTVTGSDSVFRQSTAGGLKIYAADEEKGIAESKVIVSDGALFDFAQAGTIVNEGAILVDDATFRAGNITNSGTITLNNSGSVTMQSLISDHGVINLTNSTLTVDGVITFKAYDWSSGSLNIVLGAGNAINMDWQSQLVVGSWVAESGEWPVFPAIPTVSVDVTGIESSGKTAFKLIDTLDGNYPSLISGEIIGTGAEEWHLEAVNGDAYLTNSDQSELYVNSAYANDEDGIVEDGKIVGYNAFANLDDAFKVNNAEKIVLKSSGLALNGNVDYADSFSSAKKADFTLTADEAVTVTFNGNNQLVGNVVLGENVDVILKGIDGKAAGLLLGSKGDTSAAGNTYQINGSIVNDGIAHFYVRNHKETVDVNGEIKILHSGNNQIYNKGTMNVTGTGKNYGVNNYQVTADFINVNGVVDDNGVRKGGELNLVDTAADFTTFRLGNGDDETCSTVNVNNSFLNVGGFISENSSAQIKLTGSTLNYSNVPVNVEYGNAVIGLGTGVSMTLDNSTVDAAALLSYGTISAVNGSKLNIETFTNNGTVSINDATFAGKVLTVAEDAVFNAVDSYVDLSGNSSANYGEMSISGGSFKASKKVYNYGTIKFTNANVSLNSIDMSGSGVSGKVVIVDSCVNMSSSFAMNKSASEVYVDNSVLNCTQFQMGFGTADYATGTGKVTIVNGSVVTMSNTPSASSNCNQTITIDATSRMVADGINYYSENGKYAITIDISNYAGGTNKIIDVNRYNGDMANILIRGTLPTNAQLIYGADGDVIITDTDVSKLYANSAWAGLAFGEEVTVAENKTGIIGVTALESFADAVRNGLPVVVQSDFTESVAEICNGVSLSTDNAQGVTINSTFNNTLIHDGYVCIGDLTLGENITFNAEAIYFNDLGLLSTISGSINASEVMYISGVHYGAERGNVNLKVNITETGKFTSGGVVIIRHNDYADSGVYVVGDGSKTEASYRSADYTGLYSGTLSIKDAKAEVGYMLLKNSYDADGSSYAGASLVLDNALFVSNGQFSIDSNAALTATNGSEISVAGFMDVASGSQVTLTGSTVVVNSSVSNAGTFEMDYTSTLAFVSLTNSGTFTIDFSQYNGGAFKVLDSINNNYTVEMYQALLGNAYDDRFLVIDGDLFIAELENAEVFVNNSYTGNVGDVTADGKIIGYNAFASVDDAVAAGAQAVTVSGGEYGKTGFDGVKVTIGNATYSGAVYGGNCDENAVVSETIDLTISGGELQSAVYGGSRVHGGTSYTSGGICAVAGDVNVKVTSGSVQNVFVGGDLVTRALMFVREGDINVNISGGEFNDRVYGGITVHVSANESCMAQLVGNINMTISGGDFKDRVYGGNLAGKYERGDKLSITGNISVALDVSSNSVSFAEHLVLGSSGTSAVHGNTKLTLTGLGSNLTFADNSVIVGGSGDSYYLVEGGKRTPVSFVEETKEFAFNAFTGDLNAQIKIFDTMSFAGNSEVNFADSAINLDEISNWNFESGSLITGAANAISFNGDTINLNGSWEAGAAFELGNIDAFGDYNAWNDVTVYYGGSAVNYQFEEKESKLVITKLA